MAHKKKPPAEDGIKKPTEGDARGETRRFGESHRRLPLAALAVLLALIGVGVYVAWPSIQDSLQTSAPENHTVPATEESTSIAQTPETVPALVVKAEPPPAVPETPAAPPEPSPEIIALSVQVAALQRALAERDAAPTPSPDLTSIQETMARLEEMERRLRVAPPAAAENSTTANTASNPATANTDFRTLERLVAIEKSLSTLNANNTGANIDSLRSGQAELAEQITLLRRLYETIGGREAGSARKMVLVLSFSRLSRAAALAAPFAREVEAFRTANEADKASSFTAEGAIRELSTHALSGTPTSSQLAAAFDDVALAVIHADAEAEDQDWVDATIGRLRRIVTVRRVGGDIAADSLEGRLNALHHALTSGDLAGAIALTEALPIKARSGAEEWLHGARARLAVERALSVLDAELSARVAAHWTAEEHDSE